MAQILGQAPLPWEKGAEGAEELQHKLGRFRGPVLGLLRRDPAARLDANAFVLSVRRVLERTRLREASRGAERHGRAEIRSGAERHDSAARPSNSELQVAAARQSGAAQRGRAAQQSSSAMHDGSEAQNRAPQHSAGALDSSTALRNGEPGRLRR